MKKNVLTNYPVMIAAFMLFTAAGLGYAANTNYYVWRDNPSQAEPYTNWADAATNIQAAVDRTLDGDTVYVTNGIYDTGGMKPPSYELTNRVYITKAITVRSMNGPELTIIKGAAAPGGGMGTGAVRCVYFSGAAASLIGFTLTGGYTMTNGDNTHDCGAGGVLLRTNVVVSNCVISGNMAKHSGGALLLGGGTLNNCILATNTTTSGYGGGVSVILGGVINNCALVGNTAGTFGSGGGAYLENTGATLNSCLVASNTAYRAGGVDFQYGGTLNNCTVVSNKAVLHGGGLRFLASTTGTGEVNNCIVWRNICANQPAFSNIYVDVAARINYTCSDTTTTSYGSGNIVGDPMFVDINTGNYRLTDGSPCINAGTNFSWMTDGSVQSKDLDGHSRIDRFSGLVDMGCYEYLPHGTMYGFR